MKFSGRHDIEAPIDRVFAALSDFDAHERSALRRGVQVNRIDMMTSPVPGMTWAAKVRFRGRIRDITVSLARFDPPEVIYYDVEGSGLLGQFTVDLVALSKARTRLIAALDVRPMSMSGRLIIQSLRLIKASLTRRFKARVHEYAEHLAGRLTA